MIVSDTNIAMTTLPQTPLASSSPVSDCDKVLVYPDLPDPGCEVDTNHDEVIVAILIVLLVLVTFYRLLHVWAYTLNFSEVNPRCLSVILRCIYEISKASIQGPQGWDLIVNWIMERVKRTKKSARWRIRSKSLYDTTVGDETEMEEFYDDDMSKSLPVLPRLVVETPSDASPSPVSSRSRSRPALPRPASLRSKINMLSIIIHLCSG